MKKLAILFIAATMALAAADAQAIDFKAKGIWQVGMGLSQRNFVKSVGGNKTDSNDVMNSRSRIRFQMDAVASESLSGSVHFEIGHIQWGQQAGGGALGADSTSAIKVRMAFMDWQVPDTSLKVRMGLQNLTLPTKAGNSSVAGNLDVAGIVASWQFSETVGLSALWLRPFNDNYSAEGNTNYLDNMDIWGLTLPVRLEGFEMTPWVLYGIRGKKVLMHVGRISYEKHVDDIVRAMAMLDGDTVLVVVGDGPAKQSVVNAAEECGVTHRVIFTGFIERSLLPEIYASADVCVSCSRFETQGLSIMEAMACGKPVVCPDARAFSEIITDGKDGFLFDGGVEALAARISDALNDDGTVARAGMATAASYSEESCAKMLLNLYEDLIDRRDAEAKKRR